MTTSYTNNLGLAKPATSDRNWDGPINSNANQIDATFLGGLYVQTTQIPSTSLSVTISPGTYIQNSGLIATYAGGSVAVTAAATTLLWLTDVGVLTTGTSWPTVNHVRLASVVAGATTITSVADARSVPRSVGHKGINVYEGGTDPRMGVATLAAGTFTVNTTAVTSTSRIFLTVQSAGGTVGHLAISARTAGTSFTITSTSSSETSIVGWLLIEPG